jgi:hypothetical protein
VNACQVARSKSKSSTMLLCRPGRRPSKTGIAHWMVRVKMSCEELFHLPGASLQSLALQDVS